MKTRFVLPATVVIMAFLLGGCAETSLVLQVQDAVSGGWVWGAAAHLQGRVLTSYFQTDAGPIPQRISHLTPGKASLEISAPGYVSVSIPLTLGRGRNRLAQPVALQGREIPGLSSFSIFETIGSGDISLQIRPLNAAGKAIINHPCIDMWIGAVVSEQVLDGVPVRAEDAAAATRGRTLFRGAIQWKWDGRPESLFRYSGTIPASGMTDAASLFRVIDYLVVVPDPTLITKSDLDAAMRQAWTAGGLVSGNPTRGHEPALAPGLAAARSALNGRARFFLLTSWDVRARQS
jgi:hypothetical protein